MGDVLMNLPAIRLLRQTFPKSWITLGVDRSVAPLFEPHQDIDEVYKLDGRQIKNNPSYRRALRKDLKKARFDMVFISNADKHMHWLSFRAGIPVRAGWDRKLGFLLTHRLPDDKYHANRHEIDSNIKLVALFSDKTWDGNISLHVQKESLEKIVRMVLNPALLKSQDFIVLHTGTSRAEKRWDSHRFQQLAQRIIDRMRKGIVFIGDDHEAALSEKIISELPPGSALNLAGKTTLQDLVALFSLPGTRALVSCDSGPLHVAWIMSKPVVGLYAANVVGSDPRRWGPKYTLSREIHRSMKDISVDEVEHALLDVLGEHR